MGSEVIALLDQIKDRAVVLGTLNADLVVRAKELPKPGETVMGGPLQILPGGKSANQAVAAARLGAQVHMIGAVGDDSNGDMLIKSLHDAGVDTAAVVRANVPTGSAIISVDGHGENSIIVSPGANALIKKDTVDRYAAEIRSAVALGLCLEIDLAAVIEAARVAHDAGVQVVFNFSPFRDDIPQEFWHLVDVLILNEQELKGLIGLVGENNCDWATCLVALRKLGIEKTVVTLGAKGSVVLSHGEITEIEPVAVSVVDTTGAGDAFTGTLLAGLASGIELEQLARLASLVSAQATTSVGAQASYKDAKQLKQLFRN